MYIDSTVVFGLVIIAFTCVIIYYCFRFMICHIKEDEARALASRKNEKAV